MKASAPALSITQRTALWSWVVTLLTVAAFAAVIIPQQKRVFQENLDSKAHGVAVSLRDVAAGSVVNEDFSTVVDHCMQMLKGDPALDYIVITKNDGFSLITERAGWRAEPKSAPEWHPNTREAISGLGVAPVFNRRVFYLSQPFDYSGIQWGWIHVGLSLDSYDRSVNSVYSRTLVLAFVCIAISLAASGFYARRLVQPVLHLRNVVQSVAGGDLAARAEVRARDELGTLALSVNTMTEALLRRDRILESVRFAARQFLTATDWKEAIEPVLANIGAAAEASRACLFENRPGANGESRAKHRAAWVRPDVHSKEAVLEIDYADPAFTRWMALLESGETVVAPEPSLPAAENAWLADHGIRSVIATPVRVEGQWWGFLCLADLHCGRAWTDAESSSLRAAADILGATIARQRTRDALVEAKDTLEARVLERTRELEEQVGAKEKARADLAEAQARLMAASRAAGKAEVATSVLHNVGNVLNSVGVSTTLIGDRLRTSAFLKVQRTAALIKGKNGTLADFLTKDPKGKHLPAYLEAVALELAAEHAEMLKELVQLGHNVEHIKKIVAMQQSYARISGALERVCPAELAEDALRMNDSSFHAHHIEVRREYVPGLPPINVDRHKVLQILVNLLSNAKQAVLACDRPDKQITVSVDRTEPEKIAIRVRDNGVGIPSENLTRIFQLGFTTKPEGHGFGLHSGANAATEIGGRLTAFSEGEGKGAEFTLELKAGGNISTTIAA